MRPLRTGQGRRQERWASRAAGLYLHLQVLAAELHASSPMKSPTPSTPEEPCAVEEGEWVVEGGWQEQTRSCARHQDATDAPTDSAEVPDPLRHQLPAFLSPGRD